MDTSSDFSDLNTPARLLILSISLVLVSFVLLGSLGKLTLLQPQNFSEEDMTKICPPSLTTRLWTSSGDKLGNAIIDAEYRIFHNLAFRGDRRGILGLPGTKSNSKRQDGKGQCLLWPWKPTGAVTGIRGQNIMVVSPSC